MTRPVIDRNHDYQAVISSASCAPKPHDSNKQPKLKVQQLRELLRFHEGGDLLEMLIVLAANDLEHGVLGSRQHHAVLLQLLNGHLPIHRGAAAHRVHAQVHVVAVLQQIVARLKHTHMRLHVTITGLRHLHSADEDVLNIRAGAVEVVLHGRRHHSEIHLREDRVRLLGLRSRNQRLQCVHYV